MFASIHLTVQQWRGAGHGGWAVKCALERERGSAATAWLLRWLTCSRLVVKTHSLQRWVIAIAVYRRGDGLELIPT
jgi:hypothetical protein